MSKFIMRSLDVQSPRFCDVLDGFSRHYKMGWVKLEPEKDVDAEIARWMRRAYKFGAQEHLKGERVARPDSGMLLSTSRAATRLRVS